jgi:hypothetical protein
MFEQEDQRESIPKKTEMENILSELETTTLTFENYKRYFEKVNSSTQGVIMQIQNLTREYGELKRRVADIGKRDSFKRGLEEGYIPREVYDLHKSMNKIILEAYNWKTLQAEMINIIFQKLYGLMDDVKALDIKRDALKEMRDMEEKRQELFLEVMKSQTSMFQQVVIQKFQNFDEKVMSMIMMINEQNKNDRRDLFSIFTRVISELESVSRDKRLSVMESSDEFSKKNNISDDITKKIKKPLVKKQEEPEEEDDEDEEDMKSYEKPKKKSKNEDIKKQFNKKDIEEPDFSDMEDF